MMMRPPQELPLCALTSAQVKADLSLGQLFALGLIAGLYIGLGGFLATSATRDLAATAGAGVSALMFAALFPVALILVVLAGGELFTGNCLMLIARLRRELTWRAIARNWLWVYLFNLMGVLTFTLLLAASGLLEGATALRALQIAALKANLSFGEILARGILCNWLVSLAIWLAAASLNVSGKVVLIWLPVMAFVACGFEHSIANMYFLSAGLLVKLSPALNAGLPPELLASLDGAGCLSNLAAATVGNIIGAALLVVAVYNAAYRRAAPQ
jgi:formate/nitrite transporter